MAIMKICPHCCETGDNLQRYNIFGFNEDNKDPEVEFEKGIITIEDINTNICPYCNSTLIDTNMTYDEFCLIGRTTNYDRKSLNEFIKLANDNVEVYKARMIHFRREENAKIQEKINKANTSKSSNIPKCPICGSTNLSKISGMKKAAKIGLFGIFGAGDLGKTWKCNNCGSKF